LNLCSDRIKLNFKTESIAPAISSTATHFSVTWSVSLSSVCHIRASCLNRSTDLDAIW